MEVATMKKPIAVGLMVILAVILSGCGGNAEETPTPALEQDFVPVVSVTGEVMPAVWATLSAQTSGVVVEVPVEQGDEVVAGDPLVRLDPTDARLAVRRAETALEAAQARLALLQADPLPEEIAAAEAQVEAARAVLSQAAAQRDQLKSGATEAEVAAAQAQVTVAQADQLAAHETHDQTMKCYGFTLPDGSEHEICPLLGPPEEQSRYNLQAANEELDAVQAQLDALVAGADDRIRALEAAVWAAAAQRDMAQAQLDLLRADATAEEIAIRKAAVIQAQAALDAARVTLERTEVRAPLAGIVGIVDVRTGELVAPGQSLVTVGDLSTLRVGTTDLDEVDVARVEVGQKATLTFDALPERVFTGCVARISPMAEPDAGGVNYTVIIELDEVDPAIRWGMTAFVDIEVGR
jgi:HlyD family secretion protein